MADINSIMGGWVDRQPWMFWDHINVPAGTTIPATLSPFTNPINSTDPITNTQKTKVDTNMQRGNQFPPPQCLVLMSIMFFIETDMLKTDLDALLKACYFEFKIDQKTFVEGLLWMAPGGNGLTGFTTQNGQASFQMGLPAPQYARRFGNFSKYIAPLQNFTLNVIFPGTIPTMSTVGPGFQMWAVLDGVTDRPVQ